MTTPPRVLTLRIDDPAEPIAGSLGDETGASREFRGWLGLARALETMLATGSPPGPDGPAADDRLGADRERLDR
jgi:hypothetical protein